MVVVALSGDAEERGDLMDEAPAVLIHGLKVVVVAAVVDGGWLLWWQLWWL